MKRSHCFTRIAAFLFFLACLPLSPLAFAQATGAPPPGDSPEVSPSENAERIWALRRAQAEPIDFYMPYYTIQEGVDATVFLMNPIADTISVIVTALDGRGGELPLGQYTIESRHHLDLPLRERLRGFEEDFGTGSLRLSLLGDADTLQGWTVLTTPDGQAFEMPIASPAKATTDRFVAFWDATILARPVARDVRFELLNPSAEPRRVEIETSLGRGTVTETRVLVPGSRLRVDGVDGHPFPLRGWTEIRHDGNPGDVLVTGLLGARSPIAAVPLVGRGEASERRHYESIPLPVSEKAGRGRDHGGTKVVLFRPGEEAGPVTLQALDAATGSVLGQASVPVPAGAVRSVSVERVLPSVASARAPVRLRLQAEGAPLLVQGFTSMPDGSASELMFFPRQAAHGNGTYPLPDPLRYGTVTTLVNLNDQSSRVVAQITWRGGSYALGPLDIPAGGSHRIDLDDLIDGLEPDLSGRELARDRPEAVLKWSIIEGGDQLVARTEVTPRGTQDRFGFNCWGCCWQTPEGRIVPNHVEFTPGEERDFTASVLITDCAGTMGPYPTTPGSMTFSSPFSWNGSVVTASSAADGDLGFEAQKTRITATCSTVSMMIFGWGDAYMCQETFNPRDYDPGEICRSQTASCLECNACCHNIYQQQLCEGKRHDAVTANRNACLGDCATHYMHSPGCGG